MTKHNWQGSSPNRTRGRAWQRIRTALLTEEPWCRACIATLGTYIGARLSTICDHIKPLAEGGTDDRANLAGMCSDCHDAKTAAEAARAQGRPAPVMKRKITIGMDGWPVQSR